MLTRGRAPQNGATPLYAAACNGHLEVVQALAEAGVAMNAPTKVREGRGGDVGPTYGVCVSFWGLQEGCSLSTR